MTGQLGIVSQVSADSYTWVDQDGSAVVVSVGGKQSREGDNHSLVVVWIVVVHGHLSGIGRISNLFRQSVDGKPQRVGLGTHHKPGALKTRAVTGNPLQFLARRNLVIVSPVQWACHQGSGKKELQSFCYAHQTMLVPATADAGGCDPRWEHDPSPARWRSFPGGD